MIGFTGQRDSGLPGHGAQTELGRLRSWRRCAALPRGARACPVIGFPSACAGCPALTLEDAPSPALNVSS